MGISAVHFPPFSHSFWLACLFWIFRHRRASESSSILFLSFLSRVQISWFFCVCVWWRLVGQTLCGVRRFQTHTKHFFFAPFGSLGRCLMCVCVMSLVVVVVFVFFIIFTSLRVMLGLDHRLHFPPYRHHTLECVADGLLGRAEGAVRSRRWVREKCQSLFLVFSYLCDSHNNNNNNNNQASHQSAREREI